MQINGGAAAEGLWQAFEWEPINVTDLFDQIVNRLRRNPRFCGMSIVDLDLLVADARREFQLDMDMYERRLVRAFKDAIQFDETDGAAA